MLPQNSSQVIGKLLNLDCPKDFVCHKLDQVVQTVLSDKNPDEVYTTIHALIKCGLPGILIEFFIRIVLQNSDFANHKTLQDLLIFTAICDGHKKKLRKHEEQTEHSVAAIQGIIVLIRYLDRGRKFAVGVNTRVSLDTQFDIDSNVSCTKSNDPSGCIVVIIIACMIFFPVLPKVYKVLSGIGVNFLFFLLTGRRGGVT